MKRLIGPVMRPSEDHAYFIVAKGSTKTFVVQSVWSDDPEELVHGRKMAIFEGQGIGFDSEHDLLKKAIQLWDNEQTRAALVSYEESQLLAEAYNAAGFTPDTVVH